MQTAATPKRFTAASWCYEGPEGENNSRRIRQDGRAGFKFPDPHTVDDGAGPAARPEGFRSGRYGDGIYRSSVSIPRFRALRRFGSPRGSDQRTEIDVVLDQRSGWLRIDCHRRGGITTRRKVLSRAPPAPGHGDCGFRIPFQWSWCAALRSPPASDAFHRTGND